MRLFACCAGARSLCQANHLAGSGGEMSELDAQNSCAPERCLRSRALTACLLAAGYGGSQGMSAAASMSSLVRSPHPSAYRSKLRLPPPLPLRPAPRPALPKAAPKH